MSARSEDTNSSKFQEYRDIPNGFVLPLFRLDGQKDGFRYDLFGADARERDQRYRLGLEKGWLRFDGSYQFIPHNFGNGARSLENHTGGGVFAISDALQAFHQGVIRTTNNTTYPFVNALVQPSLAAAAPFDLGFDRQRANGLVTLSPSPAVSVKVGYFNEQRRGYRGGIGTSFGFSNAVETPEDTGYLTQDVGADAELSGKLGGRPGGVHYNWFRTSIPGPVLRQPLPGHGQRRLVLDPRPRAGAALAPPRQRRDRGLGGDDPEVRQDDATLRGRVPQHLEPGPDALHRLLDQQRDHDAGGGHGPGRPARPGPGGQDQRDVLERRVLGPARGQAEVQRALPALRPVQRHRADQLPGIRALRRLLEGVPRISVPYGNENSRFDATLGYDLGAFSLEAGYKYNGMSREFRETEQDDRERVAPGRRRAQGLVRVPRRLRVRQPRLLGPAHRAERGGVLRHSPTHRPTSTRRPSAQFCTGGVVCNLRFDQAPRDVDKAFALVQLTPWERWSFNVSYTYDKSDFQDSGFGLQFARYSSFTAEADYTPSEKWNVYAFYTWEGNSDFLHGRQSGSTLSVNPLDDWTSDVDDKINSIGAGATIAIVPSKWSLHVFARWQDVDGNNDFFAPVGGAPYTSRVDVGGIKDIPNYDDTTLTTVSAELKYRLGRWGLALGGVVRALSGGGLGHRRPQQLHPQPVLPERGQRKLSGRVGIPAGVLHLVMRTGVLALSGVLLSLGAHADEVFLKSGGQLSGRIVSRDASTIEVDVGAGRIKVPASSVVRIEEGQSALQEYEARAGRLPAGDVGGWIALGEWASARGLGTQAREAYQRALSAAPDDPRANAALGNVQVGGRWLSEDEAYQAQGYVRFEGEWITPAEHEAMLRERAAEADQERQRQESEARVREAEERAEEAEARARQAEAEAAEASEGIPLWYGWGGGPATWSTRPIVTRPIGGRR